MPFLKASMNTSTSGRNRKTPRKTKETAISVQRAGRRSVLPPSAGCAALAAAATGSAIAIAAPGLQQVEDEQHGEGDDQHDRPDRRCGGIVIFLQPDDNEQRCDLRHVGQVA